MTPDELAVLAEVKAELDEVMRRTKYGWFGEHVVTHRHVRRALELLHELTESQK